MSGTPLFQHIRYMLITTVPTLIITLTIFTVAGFTENTSDNTQIMLFTQSLTERFTISPWLLLVPIATGILIAKKIPSIITLFLSTLLALVMALIFQPEILLEIANTLEISKAKAMFKGALLTLYGETQITTDNSLLQELVATRGMAGMLHTIWLIICAMCFGGAMTASGMIKSITTAFMKLIKNRVSLVGSTVGSGLFLNLATADQYISVILTSNMFKDIYKKMGYESRLLSRTTEDAVTVTSVLIPWNSCGMTQATILNVPTITYLPYCFFNLISPIMTLIVAIIGYKIKKVTKSELE